MRNQDLERDNFIFHFVCLICLNFFSYLVDVQYIWIYFLLFLLPIKVQMPLQGAPHIGRGMNLETEARGGGGREEWDVLFPDRAHSPWGRERGGPKTKAHSWWSGSPESCLQPPAKRGSWDWQVDGTDISDKRKCWLQPGLSMDLCLTVELQCNSGPLSSHFCWLCGFPLSSSSLQTVHGFSLFSLFLIFGTDCEGSWLAVLPTSASLAAVNLNPLTQAFPILTVVWSSLASDSSAWEIQPSPAVWPHLSSFLKMMAKKFN